MAYWALYVFVIFEQLVLMALLCLGILMGLGVLISTLLDVPFVPTPRRHYHAITAALIVQNGDVVYELGSGSGDLSLALARRFPNARFVGIERNPLLYWYSRCNSFLHGNPSNLLFERANFFETDMSKATKIYAYLLPDVMNRLQPSLEKQSHPIRVVSRAFIFKNKQPLDTIELSKKKGVHGEQLLYVYKFEPTAN